MEKINLDNIKELKIEVALNKFNEKKGFKAMSKSELSENTKASSKPRV